MMNSKIKKHPIFTHNNEIQNVCLPLHKLNISYFAHVIISENRFSALTNNPQFAEHYFKNKYFDADIHLAKIDMGSSIIWDHLDLSGESQRLNEESIAMGIEHTFTLVEQVGELKNYYHFASHIKNNSINQIYISHQELLKKFIRYYHDTLNDSPIYKNSHQIKFDMNEKTEFALNEENKELFHSINQEHFLEDVALSHDSFIIYNKENKCPVSLSPQRTKCLYFLLLGYSIKEIAQKSGLSKRTVEHYVSYICKQLHCKNTKALLLKYEIHQ